MRILFILLIYLLSLPSSSLAETLYVGDKKSYHLLPYASLYTDGSQKMTIEDVQKVSWSDIDVEELAFPVTKEAHWLRYTIENNTTSNTSYYITYDVSTINFLDVYIMQDGVVQQQYLTGAHRPLEGRALVYHAYLFPLTLKPGETKEIYVRFKHLFSEVPAHMHLVEQNAFLLDEYDNNVLQGVFYGVMIVMFFYNLVLYIMTRYKPYLAYILYLGTLGTWMSLRTGYGMYLFDFLTVDLYRYFEITISMLFTVFIIWFITLVLELKSVMHKSYKMFQGLATLFVFSWVCIILMLFFDIEGYYAYPSLLFFINFLAMNIAIIVVTGVLGWKGNKTALYIFIAWMLFVSSMIILAFALTGVIPQYDWIIPYMQLTMVIEMVMLSLILGERYRQQEQLLRQQSRLASMGSMLENIAHQWRQPLSEINADLLALEMHIEDNDRKGIKKRMQAIEEQTSMMSKIIDDFQQFYVREKPKTMFDIEHLIQKSIDLLRNRMLKTNIVCRNIHCKGDQEESFKIKGVENEYLQVVLAVLNNAIDALEYKEQDERKIDICLFKERKNVVLQISNSGEKIQRRDLGKIFDPYYTTKEKKTHNGIGLFMSKKIIDESFYGSLEIENMSDGVQVTIKVPYV